MNKSVNVNRVLLVIIKYVYENRRSFSLMLLAVGAFLVLSMGVNLIFTNTNPNLFREESQIIYYFIGLFLSGCLSAGVHFSELGSKSKAIHYLLAPASSAEKFICAIFFGVIVFFFGYTLVFYAIDSVVVILANIKFETHWRIVNLFEINKYENRIFDGPFSSFFYIYFVAQAFFLLASVYFSKNGLFKAIIGVGIIWVLSIFLLMTFIKSFPYGQFHSGSNMFEIAEISGVTKKVLLPSLITMPLIFFYKFLLTPLLWTSAYFRLKEKQL
jgi:hypothetical protein